MEIHIDLIPPEDGYFISVELPENGSLGFDNSWVGHDIRKQIMIGERHPNKEPDGTWVTLEVFDGEPKKKRKVEWVDQGSVAVINNNAWETVEEIEIPKDIDEKLMKISSRIYKNRNNLDSIGDDLKELDKFLSERMDQVLDKFSN